ncbi:hypothetical protein [Nocardioides taihuensis]|uniref:Matrixin family metalloprotease n=1 Tax=Nocardioides taihuensis TaxID=1835606 RepID=A0ABW0BMG4_9ACTN
MVRARAALLLALVPALLAGLVLVAGPASSRPAEADRAPAVGGAGDGPEVPLTVRPRLGGDTVALRATRAPSWPGSRIRYWAGLPDSYDWSLRAGVAAWNRTGLDMRFVPTGRARAQLRITVGDTDGHDGLATVGYRPHSWVRLRPGLVQPMVPTMSRPYARVVAAHVIAHELGHTLGLQHTGGCRLMTADLRLPTCRMMAPQPGFYDCRVVDGRTLDTALHRYGGRRTLAPSACPLDPLPPRLRGVSFDGGLAADAPVSLGWAEPQAPPGSRVLAMVSSGSRCRFPVTRNYWGEAEYDEGQVEELRRLDPSREGWAPPSYGIDDRCYALQLVNGTGAGRPLKTQVLQSWVPAPDPPAVGVVRPLRREYAGAPGYLAEVTPPVDGDPDVLAVVAAPAGECPTAWPADQDPVDPDLLVDVAADGTVEVPTGLATPCLAFFAVRHDLLRAGDPVVVETADPLPPPAPPPVTDVSATVPPDGTWAVAAELDERVVALAYLVAPSGQCLTSWPADQDPEAHLVTGPLDAAGEGTPCFSFVTVDGSHQISTGVLVWDTGQQPPGPALYLRG